MGRWDSRSTCHPRLRWRRQGRGTPGLCFRPSESTMEVLFAPHQALTVGSCATATADLDLQGLHDQGCDPRSVVGREQGGPRELHVVLKRLCPHGGWDSELGPPSARWFSFGAGVTSHCLFTVLCPGICKCGSCCWALRVLTSRSQATAVLVSSGCHCRFKQHLCGIILRLEAHRPGAGESVSGEGLLRARRQHVPAAFSWLFSEGTDAL